MQSPREDTAPRKSPENGTIQAVYFIVCVAALIIPLVVSLEGRDGFRLPKELVFRAEVLLLLAATLIGLLLGHLDPRRIRWRQPAVILPAAIVAWATVTTIASTNRALSWPTLLYATGAALVFVATYLVSRNCGLRTFDWLLWSGILNAILYLGVALRLMDNPLPLTSAFSGHYSATGLLGNANDVSAALLPIAIGATAAALASTKRRMFYATAATLLTATILVSVSVAAIGALVAAFCSFALIWNWRRALVVLLAIATFVGLLSSFHLPIKVRVKQTLEAMENARWDQLASGRLTAFTTAFEMFKDHPITGVGPGTFGWQYYPYKLEISERAPDVFLASAASRFNFEEVHNDHLEVLAETGAPGYFLFLAVLFFVAKGSRRDLDDERSDPRIDFARLTLLPLTVGTAFLALAQYPLQLTSSLTTLLFVTALAVGWNEREDVAEERDLDA